MKTLIIYPKNKRQLIALKSFMRTAQISFEERTDGYNPEFVIKIQEGFEQIARRETRVVSIDDL